MKRLISYILITAMLASVLPTVSFADTENSAVNDLSGNTSASKEITVEDASVSGGAAEPSVGGDDSAMTAFLAEAEAQAEDPVYIKELLKKRIEEKAGLDNINNKMASDSDFAQCIDWLFSDYEMLCYYIYGGEPEANGGSSTGKRPTAQTYMSSLEVLTKLYINHKDDVADTNPDASLFKRLMAAVALTHCVENNFWPERLKIVGFHWHLESEPLKRYEIYKKFYLNGFLIDQFDQYNVEELRMVVNCPVDNDQLEWMHYYYRVKRLGNTDYANNPIQITRNKIGAVGGWFPYKVYDFNPYTGPNDMYYSEENYDKWKEKYALEVHDEYFDFKVPYGYNTEAATCSAHPKGEVCPSQWIHFETGGVCGDISFCSIVGFNAMGIPSMQVTQPGHCSFWQYYKSGSTVNFTHGYNVFGLVQSTSKEHGYTHLPASWGELPYTSHYNMGYLFQGMDAIYSKDNTNYEKAENLFFMADSYMANREYEKAAALYNKVIEAQYFNMDGWDGLAKAYEAMNMSDEDYYELSVKAADSLKWYPLAVNDYLTGCIMPKMKSQVIKADMLVLLLDTFNIGAGATSSNCHLSQPAWCVQLAGNCRSKLAKLAAFSFDNNRITINKDYSASGTDFLYSFDGGNTWNTHTYTDGETFFTLTAEEIDQITDENDILCKLDGETKTHRIVISTAKAPSSNLNVNTPNDNEDCFINLESGLEYSLDSGETWQDLNRSSIFEGDLTLLIRRKATGAVLASDCITVEFTQGEGTAERSYIKMKNNVSLISYPTGMSSNPASYCCDGDVNTYWINQWSNTNYSMYKDSSGTWQPNHKYEFVFELAYPHYISALSYLPGDVAGAIRGCEVYVSSDNKTWQLAGSTSLWGADTNEKTIEFDKPAYAKYVKITTTEVGTTVLTMGTRSVDVGYATAKEFKLYENYGINSKTPSELRLNTDSCKTQYKVGDKLNTVGLRAELVYTDSTVSIIPVNELEFDTDIFMSTDTNKVTASYQGISAAYDVSVAANDRTASSIVSVAAANRKYYAGDTFETSDALVLVTDGTESWYLLPNEFTVEGDLTEGTSTLTAVYNNLTKSFTVTAQKAVSGIEINTDSEDFKSQYFIGDSLDLSGLTVTLNYTDGTTAQLDESDYFAEIYDGNEAVDFDSFSKTSGNKTLRISLLNRSETYADGNIMVFPYISSGDFEFEAIEGTNQCKLTSYNPSGTDSGQVVKIPDKVVHGGTVFTVVSIEGNAFINAAEIESVYIPNTVKTIASNVFTSCEQLTSVYMMDYESFDGFESADDAFAQVENGYVYVSSALAAEGIDSPIYGYAIADFTASAGDIVLTPPTKLDYLLTEPLDTTGMSVAVVGSDGSIVGTNNYTLIGYDPNVTGTQTVTVSVNGTSLNAEFNVNVAFPAINITKSPLGAAYALGDTAAPLTAEAAADLGEVLYQWYRSETDELNGEPIDGANEASYTPVKEGYYYAAAYMKDANGNSREYVYSDIARVLIGDYEAIIGAEGYAVLADAVNAAVDKDTVRLCKDVVISSTITTDGKSIILEGGGHSLTRGSSYALEFIKLSNSANLTLKNVTLDGGAVWTGDIDPTLGRGKTNSGLLATRPLIIALAGTTLTLSEGSVLQNNYNNYSTNAYYTGGAVYMGHEQGTTNSGATMLIDGGAIKNNASAIFGSAVYMRGNSSFTVQGGSIEGNSDPAPAAGYNASAICVDNDSTATVRGGTFKNNLGGKQGGVFWIGNGTLTIKGGVFENNSSESGGVAFFHSGTTSTLQLTGGEFRSNSATENGGVIYIQKNASISGGVFENNSAKNGGVLWTNSTVTLNGGKFTGNSANSGDAIYLNSAQSVSISGIDTLQEIYFASFKTLSLIGNLSGKTLILTTPTEITSSTNVATMTIDCTIDAKINGRKLYSVNDEGWKLRINNDYSVKYDNGAALVSAPQADTLSVIFAAFSNGVMTSVGTSEVTFTTAGELTVPAPEAFSAEGADTIKVMLWDNLEKMSPKCDANVHNY